MIYTLYILYVSKLTVGVGSLTISYLFTFICFMYIYVQEVKNV